MSTIANISVLGKNAPTSCVGQAGGVGLSASTTGDPAFRGSWISQAVDELRPLERPCIVAIKQFRYRFELPVSRIHEVGRVIPGWRRCFVSQLPEDQPGSDADNRQERDRADQDRRRFMSIGRELFHLNLAGCGLSGPVTDLSLSCRRFHGPSPNLQFPFVGHKTD